MNIVLNGHQTESPAKLQNNCIKKKNVSFVASRTLENRNYAIRMLGLIRCVTVSTKSNLVDLDRECLAHESASQGRQNTLHSAWESQIMALIQTLSSQTTPMFNDQILARLLQVLIQTQPKAVEGEIQRTLAIFLHGSNFTTVNRILTTDGLMLRGRSNESVLLYSQVTIKF